MSLRFFADHCIPSSVTRMLSDVDHEVFLLRDYIPTDSPDSLVIEKAQELDAILISLNADFADIVTYPPTNYKGIIALQLRNRPEIIPELMRKLKDYLLAHDNMLHYKGIKANWLWFRCIELEFENKGDYHSRKFICINFNPD